MKIKTKLVGGRVPIETDPDAPPPRGCG